ncbi:UbiA prenyltransferase family protein [Patescibacteria group bacterium]|nr:UbiA prenyltransferase family protein [Patescibacteria group bacterium]
MMANFKSCAKLLRLPDTRGYILLVLFGFLLAKGFLFPFKDIVIFWTIVFLLSGFGFSINDCFDQKEDKFDRTKKNPIVSKEITFRRALTFSCFLAGLGLILSSFYGLTFFLLCLSDVLLIFFYSSPPFRLKSRPLFDLIAHGLFAGAFVLLSSLLFFKNALNQFYYLITFSAFYFSVILELRNEYEDYESDKIAGLKTSAQALGKQKTESSLRYLAAFYPLFLLPIFYFLFIISPCNLGFLFFFLLFTLVFLFLFLVFKNHKLVKNYKLFDGYNILSYGLILIAVLYF